MNNHYNYIITGAGCAGLSLLMRLLQEHDLQHKKILVIDQSPKTKNDRTWCFWEKENGLFEPVVHHRWNALQFKSKQYSDTFSIAPYQYKLIQGLDLYQHVMQAASAFSNVEFKYEKVTALQTENKYAVVTTENAVYRSDYVFNSIVFQSVGSKYYLRQHFKGILIEAEENVFNDSVATFMDFTVHQNHGTTFMYMLPTAPNKALVEYTLFTENVFAEDIYDEALKAYIQDDLKIASYKILHEEFGVIPMTDFIFSNQDGRIINIGTAGGQTKSSSGFTFQFIQKRTKQIVDALLQKKRPFVKRNFNDKKFHLYDKVLLNILFNNKMSGADIFATIFQKNAPSTVLKFLDNETDLPKEIKMMRFLPLKIFLPATMNEIFR